MTPTPLRVDLTLDQLDELARFTAYLRVEPVLGSAEGFGIEGATMISKTISRDTWEGMGRPVSIPITLRTVAVEVDAQ